MKLTREQIEQMPAGTEMDNLIHERVMGLRLTQYIGHEHAYTEACYSVDMADAWLVVEHVSNTTPEHSINRNGFALDEVIDTNTPGFPVLSRCKLGFEKGTAPKGEMPLAICRAALLTIL